MRSTFQAHEDRWGPGWMGGRKDGWIKGSMDAGWMNDGWMDDGWSCCSRQERGREASVKPYTSVNSPAPKWTHVAQHANVTPSNRGLHSRHASNIPTTCKCCTAASLRLRRQDPWKYHTNDTKLCLSFRVQVCVVAGRVDMLKSTRAEQSSTSSRVRVRVPVEPKHTWWQLHMHAKPCADSQRGAKN